MQQTQCSRRSAADAVQQTLADVEQTAPCNPAPTERASSVISYATYKILHLFGLFMMFTALGGASVHAASGGERSASSRRIVGILHGVGATLSLVAGFGVLARLDLTAGLPGWVLAKLALWLIVVGLIVLPYRSKSAATAMAYALPVLGLIGAYLAIGKPF